MVMTSEEAGGATSLVFRNAGAVLDWPAFRILRRTSALVVVGVVLFAVIGPYVAPHDPVLTSARTLDPPSLSHLMGTDQFGRDIFSRVMHGARQDLAIGLAAVAIALLLGSILGAVSGYAGGLIDSLMMRTVDVIQSFPLFVLALALVSIALSPGSRTMIIVIAVINVPIFSRLVRVEILARKSLPYVDAARCGGNSWLKILLYHLYPNAMGPVLATASLTLAWAILDVAALSFLGVGIRPPTPEWGVMLSEGAPYALSGEWWVSFFPGLAICLAVLAFHALGDELQDWMDPRRQVFTGM
jgi:peptide/nickel transport system permease protein